MASSGRGQVRQRGRRKEGRGDGGEQMREARQEGSRGERPDRKGGNCALGAVAPCGAVSLWLHSGGQSC